MDKVEIIRKVIDEANGKVVGILFVKKDGTRRAMAFRTGVQHSKFSGDVKGTEPEATAKRKATLKENGMLCVHDQNKGFRTINMVTALRVRANGKTYNFEEA